MGISGPSLEYTSVEESRGKGDGRLQTTKGRMPLGIPFSSEKGSSRCNREVRDPAGLYRAGGKPELLQDESQEQHLGTLG